MFTCSHAIMWSCYHVVMLSCDHVVMFSLWLGVCRSPTTVIHKPPFRKEYKKIKTFHRKTIPKEKMLFIEAAENETMYILFHSRTNERFQLVLFLQIFDTNHGIEMKQPLIIYFGAGSATAESTVILI